MLREFRRVLEVKLIFVERNRSEEDEGFRSRSITDANKHSLGKRYRTDAQTDREGFEMREVVRHREMGNFSDFSRKKNVQVFGKIIHLESTNFDQN